MPGGRSASPHSFIGRPQWLLRQAAKHDPQWLAVYTRSLAHPLIREPHGYAFTKDAKPKPILPGTSRWML
jgi:hypothetical protein